MRGGSAAHFALPHRAPPPADMSTKQQFVAIIPAAGRASRLSPLPCSKELYPIGIHANKDNSTHPKVVSHYLLDKFKRAGVEKVFFSLRKDKSDILDYFADGAAFGVDIAYIVPYVPYGVPYTIDRAYQFVKNEIVALGFPDILFEPENAYETLLARQKQRQADVVLGLFPADRPDKCDMVELNEDDTIKRIVVKPEKTSLTMVWGIAIWTPRFTQYLHNFLDSPEPKGTEKELQISDVILAASRDGLHVDTIQVSQKPFIDIGTPEDLQRAIQQYFPRS